MKKNGFMEGAIIATAAIIISKLLGVLYVIPFYDIIGEQGGALYGYAYNIYNIFLIISSAGIPLAISKLTSEYNTKGELNKKAEIYNISKKIIGIFSLLSFLICFIFAKPIAHLVLGSLSKGNTIEDVAFVIRCVSFALIIVPLLSISRGYLQGHKYIAPSSLSQVIEQIVRIIVILVGSYISLKIFHLPLKYAVGISTFAAAIGALFAFLFLHIKMKDVRKNDNKNNSITKEEKKEVISNLIKYSIPFILINIAINLYNTTDMILMNRGLHALGFLDQDIENISSIFTTWGNKILSIVTAIASGLVISLIPSLVNAFIKEDHKTVTLYFNKILQVLLFIILPLTIFMSIYAKPIWNVFYSSSTYGPLILKYTILLAVMDSGNIAINSALQGLYKTKLIYISQFSGFLLNLLLDIPLMFLFNKLGIYPFYGAIAATAIGYFVAHSIPLMVLNKKDKISYKQTITNIPKIFISCIILVVINILFKRFIPVPVGRIKSICYLIIPAILSFGIYYGINFKLINQLLSDKIKIKK